MLTQEKNKQKTISIIDGNAALMLYNDDVNTFDHVILSLIEVCGLTFEKAVERTFFVHYNGMGVVKKGKLNIMQQMKKGLQERGLKAEVIDNLEKN